MGRRHLYIDIRCPKPLEHLSGRVEFTEARLRRDYVTPDLPERRNRLARMGRGSILRPPPFITDMRDRPEGAPIRITADQARCLQRDRVWRAQYVLLGPNSNTGLRAAAQECNCPLPAHLTSAVGGFLGEFPGINLTPGPELPVAEWAIFGLPQGPQPVPLPQTRVTATPSADVIPAPTGRGG